MRLFSMNSLTTFLTSKRGPTKEVQGHVVTNTWNFEVSVSHVQKHHESFGNFVVEWRSLCHLFQKLEYNKIARQRLLTSIKRTLKIAHGRQEGHLIDLRRKRRHGPSVTRLATNDTAKGKCGHDTVKRVLVPKPIQYPRVCTVTRTRVSFE